MMQAIAILRGEKTTSVFVEPDKGQQFEGDFIGIPAHGDLAQLKNPSAEVVDKLAAGEDGAIDRLYGEEKSKTNLNGRTILAEQVILRSGKSHKIISTKRLKEVPKEQPIN